MNVTIAINVNGHRIVSLKPWQLLSLLAYTGDLDMIPRYDANIELQVMTVGPKVKVLSWDCDPPPCLDFDGELLQKGEKNMALDPIQIKLEALKDEIQAGRDAWGPDKVKRAESAFRLVADLLTLFSEKLYSLDPDPGTGTDVKTNTEEATNR